MSTSIEALQSEVLKLSPSDRAKLLDRLIVSLDQDVQIEAAWDAEADRREADWNSGAEKPLALAEVIAGLEQRFPG